MQTRNYTTWSPAMQFELSAAMSLQGVRSSQLNMLIKTWMGCMNLDYLLAQKISWDFSYEQCHWDIDSTSVNYILLHKYPHEISLGNPLLLPFQPYRVVCNIAVHYQISLITQTHEFVCTHTSHTECKAFEHAIEMHSAAAITSEQISQLNNQRWLNSFCHYISITVHSCLLTPGDPAFTSLLAAHMALFKINPFPSGSLALSQNSPPQNTHPECAAGNQTTEG